MTRRIAVLAGALALLAASGAAAEEERAPLTDPKREGQVRRAFIETNPGGSKADKELRMEAADAVYARERTLRPNCEPELMSIRVLDEQGIGRWTERWFVRSCFERFPYRVTYAPANDPKHPKKKTEIKVTPDTGKHGSPMN